MELKISRPGTLAVFFSINVSMISKLSFSAYSFNSVSCASKLKTWRSSSSVLLRMKRKYFVGCGGVFIVLYFGVAYLPADRQVFGEIMENRLNPALSSKGLGILRKKLE